VLIPLWDSCSSPVAFLDVRTVLACGFGVGDHKQRDFCHTQTFAIATHLLTDVSPAALFHNADRKLFNIFAGLLWADVQRGLLAQILLNLEV
jgi:hypothetical protein